MKTSLVAWKNSASGMYVLRKTIFLHLLILGNLDDHTVNGQGVSLEKSYIRVLTGHP